MHFNAGNNNLIRFCEIFAIFNKLCCLENCNFSQRKFEQMSNLFTFKNSRQRTVDCEFAGLAQQLGPDHRPDSPRTVRATAFQGSQQGRTGKSLPPGLGLLSACLATGPQRSPERANLHKYWEAGARSQSHLIIIFRVTNQLNNPEIENYEHDFKIQINNFMEKSKHRFNFL